MDKIVGKIFATKDYSKFKRLDYNRKLTERRKQKLIASLSIKEIINPIIVNENMEIIDGQGRFDAKKALKRQIYYIVSEGATIDDCRRMNKYNTKWSAYDFAQSFADAGNENFQRLLNMCKKLEINIARALKLSGKGRDARSSANIENGTLIFGEKMRKCLKM